MAKKAFIVDNGIQPGHTTNDLGHTANKFRDVHLHRNVHADGTIHTGAIEVAAGGYITIDGVTVGTGGGGGGGGASVSTASTIPQSPNNGDLWYNSEDGSLYVYFNDGSSSQWVQVVNPFGTPSIFELDGITDGSNGNVLTTDGNGTATFSALPFIPLNLVQLNDFPSTESQNQVLTTDGSNNYAFEYVASENLAWTYYNDVADLPTASTKHGMFAHVHNTGKAYYAHAGNWVELANISDLFSESYNDLSDLPSIPQVLTDLQITDGTAEQVLTANGDGTYTFADRIGARMQVGATAPTGQLNLQGDLWYSTDDGSMYVYYVDADNGQWVQVVNPFGVPGLDELDDVVVNNVQDYQVLQYSPTAGQWINAKPSIQHLSDVDDSDTPSNGQILRYNDSASEWKISNFTYDYHDLTSLPSIQDLTDVTASSNPAHQNFLRWDSAASSWTFDVVEYEDLATKPNLQELADVDSDATLVNNNIVFYNSIANEWQFKDFALQQLGDVNVNYSTINDEQVLTWDSATSKWKPSDRIGARVLVGETAPPTTTALQGDIWYSSDDGSMYVYYVDADNGQWVQVVNPFGVPGLDELDDAQVSNVQPNHLLQYNDTIGQWVNTYPSIQHMSDVDDSSPPTNGQILKYNDSDSEFKLGLYDYHDLTSLPSIQDLTDVTNATNPSHQNFLRWDSATSSWGFDVVEYEDLATKPALRELTDVDSDAVLSNNQIMFYNSISAEFQFKNFDLQQLGDVFYSSPNEGQVLTWDSAASQWEAQDRVGASVTISATAPSTTYAIAGDIWYSSDEGSFYIYYQDVSSSQWVQVINPLPENFPKHNWKETSSTSYNAIVNESLFVDCSSAPVVINLPSNPAMGDEIRIVDATGNASTNNITINRNGNPIEGANSNVTISADRTALGLVFYNATQGWLYTEK